MARLTLAELREPITATCARCGNEEAVILPDPAPRGTFYCKPCFEASLLRWLDEEITESEARVLDGNR